MNNLNILVHDMINLLYYEYWTDKQKYLYVNLAILINEHSWFSMKLKLLCKQQNLFSHGLFNAASFSEKWFNHSSQIIGKKSNNVTVKAKCFLTNSSLHSDFARKIYNIIFQLIHILIMYPWQFKQKFKIGSISDVQGGL